MGGERSNQVHQYDIQQKQWTCLAPAGGAEPEPRAGHSAAIHGGNLYIFGGKGEENVKFNDLWRFDLA